MDEMSERRADHGHEALPHTADAGLRAWGPTLESTFEEAAVALAELTAERTSREAIVTGIEERIALEADDLVGLAFAWLNELVGLIDLDGALSRVGVTGIESSARGWSLQAWAEFVSFDDRAIRRMADVKSATYHGLAVDETRGGWAMTAYLDI